MPLRCQNLFVATLVVALGPLSSRAAEQRLPLSLHPDNPRYFLFRDKPTVLITSAEHYGALLNADFDYARYFDALRADDLNLTRTFSGVYREVPGSFNIRANTLAPRDAAYVSPWARAADQPGKFDLTKWNDAYFARLKALMAAASERGVVVEFVLFCTFYEDVLWDICPLNARNNVNGVGKVGRTEAHTLKEQALVDAQLAFVRKVVAELKEFDNFYYEVCNEPYFAGVADDWQRLVAKTVAEAEKDFPHKHLVARNIANGSEKVDRPDPNVSVYNFHYANPPAAVAQNAHLNKPIAYDETGFRGSGDAVYRVHGWQFLFAGGAVYNNLDYSFTAEAEGGTAPVAPPTPGGGGPALRRQMRVLRSFMDSFDLPRLQPRADFLKRAGPQVQAWAVATPPSQYGVYLSRLVEETGADGKGTGKFADPHAGDGNQLLLHLPAGNYKAEWIDPKTGETKTEELTVPDAGEVSIGTPGYTEDIALRLRRSRG